MINNLKITKIIKILFIIIITYNCITSIGNQDKNKKALIYFINIQNKKTAKLSCKIAITESEKRKGFMYKKKIHKNECIIFIYQIPQILHFWMSNTYVPLSIAFVDNNNTITSIHKMKPLDESNIISDKKVIYAIETKQGWFKKHKIIKGNTIKISY